MPLKDFLWIQFFYLQMNLLPGGWCHQATGFGSLMNITKDGMEYDFKKVVLKLSNLKKCPPIPIVRNNISFLSHSRFLPDKIFWNILYVIFQNIIKYSGIF